MPRHTDTPEGDGYLIGLCNLHIERRTNLLVLDAKHLDEGPIATVKLPLRLRNRVHGHWVAGEALESVK